MRKRDPGSKRTAALVKRAKNIRSNSMATECPKGHKSILECDCEEWVPINPRPWHCEHLECTKIERLFLRTGRRTRTVPAAAEVLAAAAELRALHPEHGLPLRAAVAWRFGISAESVRKALAAARRTR
jgi:hypothetical protein